MSEETYGWWDELKSQWAELWANDNFRIMLIAALAYRMFRPVFSVLWFMFVIFAIIVLVLLYVP